MGLSTSSASRKLLAILPISRRHPASSPTTDTLALYHFDEGSGEELEDSSGNNHHGKVVNAKWVPGIAGGPP